MVHVLRVTAQRRQRSGTGTLKPHVATSGLKGATAASSTAVFYNPYFIKSQSGAGRRIIPYSVLLTGSQEDIVQRVPIRRPADSSPTGGSAVRIRQRLKAKQARSPTVRSVSTEKSQMVGQEMASSTNHGARS